MESEKRINWLSLFIKVIIIFIFTLIIIWLISKIVGRNKLSEVFTNNINNMEKVSIDYFKTVDLPLDKGRSLKITLEELMEKKLIVSVNGESESMCDTKKSYSKITREKNNYIVTTTLKCGEEKSTIKKKFSLEDCRNCNQNKDNETTTNNNSNNTNITDNNNSNNITNNTSSSNGITYYEHAKESISYTKWMRGSKKGNNIENKYEYYGVAYDTYYSLGVIPKDKKTITYTLKLDNVPNSEYYFTTIEEVDNFDKLEEDGYLNEDDLTLYKGKKINIPTGGIYQYSLGESNISYKLLPYYRRGSFYVRITVNVKNTDNVKTYYDSKQKEEMYIVPLKFKLKFASNKIQETKPSGEYETISYYRYIITDRKTIWSTENNVEGYTKTGNTKIENTK